MGGDAAMRLHGAEDDARFLAHRFGGECDGND